MHGYGILYRHFRCLRRMPLTVIHVYIIRKRKEVKLRAEFRWFGSKSIHCSLVLAIKISN